MTAQVPRKELNERMRQFRSIMDTTQPTWELAVFLGRVNQYYFTGTMQDGLLLVPRESDPVFWVRRSYERACDESLFQDIRPMKIFRDAAEAMARSHPKKVIHIETALVPFGLVERFRRYFPCGEVATLDTQIARTRAVKTPCDCRWL